MGWHKGDYYGFLLFPNSYEYWTKYSPFSRSLMSLRILSEATYHREGKGHVSQHQLSPANQLSYHCPRSGEGIWRAEAEQNRVRTKVPIWNSEPGPLPEMPVYSTRSKPQTVHSKNGCIEIVPFVSSTPHKLVQTADD